MDEIEADTQLCVDAGDLLAPARGLVWTIVLGFALMLTCGVLAGLTYGVLHRLGLVGGL